VTYSGHYADLSAPATMSLAGFIAVSALPAGLPVALGCGMLAGVAVGLVNGVAIGYARVNPIIWTLAMAFLLDGLLRAVYGGNQIYPDGSGGAGRLFLHLAEARIGPLPLVTLVMLLLFGAGQLVLAKTRFGAGAQLTGSAYQAARLSGVAVGSVVMRAFALSALAAAIAGLFATSLNQLGGFEVGRGADFDAVTAIVLGGVALGGGSGSLAGVLGGVIVIGLGSNIMDLLGFSYQWKMVVTGAVFIAVVAATSLAARRGGDQL
jgi:ribose/xylose/arabinose/galactoside ABC-type transport system permease subunit